MTDPEPTITLPPGMPPELVLAADLIVREVDTRLVDIDYAGGEAL